MSIFGKIGFCKDFLRKKRLEHRAFAHFLWRFFHVFSENLPKIGGGAEVEPFADLFNRKVCGDKQFRRHVAKNALAVGIRGDSRDFFEAFVKQSFADLARFGNFGKRCVGMQANLRFDTVRDLLRAVFRRIDHQRNDFRHHAVKLSENFTRHVGTSAGNGADFFDCFFVAVDCLKIKVGVFGGGKL